MMTFAGLELVESTDYFGSGLQDLRTADDQAHALQQVSIRHAVDPPWACFWMLGFMWSQGCALDVKTSLIGR